MTPVPIDATARLPARHPARRTWPKLAAVALATALICTSALSQARRFQAEGADTGAGLGPRHIALGGTGVTTAEDALALYYNPAGLPAVQGLEIGVSRQLNAHLHPLNFAGIAWRLPLPEGAPRVTVAAAFYPRMHARASGAFDEADFESLFLRYLLPGIAGTFDGEIDTKTKSTRVGVGYAPGTASTWSAGAYLERIDCRSTFCGVHATSNGFTTSSTGAKATGIGFGLRWQASPDWTWAASVSDLRTRLTVTSVTTDAGGTRVSQTSAQFPRKWAAGVAWQAGAGWRLAAEYEATRGQYGRSEVDLQLLRLGAEKPAGDWTWRAGAMVPVRIDSSMTGRLRTPFPFSPTLGLGWRAGPLKVDLALYAHAVMSMHADAPRMAADLGLSLSY